MLLAQCLMTIRAPGGKLLQGAVSRFTLELSQASGPRDQVENRALTARVVGWREGGRVLFILSSERATRPWSTTTSDQQGLLAHIHQLPSSWNCKFIVLCHSWSVSSVYQIITLGWCMWLWEGYEDVSVYMFYIQHMFHTTEYVLYSIYMFYITCFI